MLGSPQLGAGGQEVKGSSGALPAARSLPLPCRMKETSGWQLAFCSPRLDWVVERVALNARVLGGSLGDHDKMVAAASCSEILLWALQPDGNGTEIGEAPIRGAARGPETVSRISVPSLESATATLCTGEQILGRVREPLQAGTWGRIQAGFLVVLPEGPPPWALCRQAVALCVPHVELGATRQAFQGGRHIQEERSSGPSRGIGCLFRWALPDGPNRLH